MNLFKRKETTSVKPDSQSNLAETALNAIHDGVIIADRNGVVQFINPAAARMINIGPHQALGLDYGLVIKLESKEGRELTERENPFIQAMKSGQSLEPTQFSLITANAGQLLPISLTIQTSNDASLNHIITFRDITKELAEEGEQTEFISTASHEMRTPVATIDGYLSLALNPQTATIDERARGYLTAAERASKHLGKLFQDLLDVTKLDDGRIRPHFVPVEMIELVQSISDDYAARAKEARLTYTFGSSEPVSMGGNRRMSQVVYGYVDIDFMHEIMDNLIENAIKYTPTGGSIYVNVRGDGDRVLINVTDTGMGISAEDLGHIFQKFYRVDNSDTRTIGGTGLGLYLVKQRAEAMGGKVWAESAFGEGSTFYVSLPRITTDEYEKRMIAIQNQQMMVASAQPAQPTAPQFASQAALQPVPQQPVPQQPVPQQPVPQQPVPQQPVPQQPAPQQPVPQQPVPRQPIRTSPPVIMPPLGFQPPTSAQPSVQPPIQPSAQPPVRPSVQSIAQPPVQPPVQPIVQPSVQPPVQPSVQPPTQTQAQPSMQPLSQPSMQSIKTVQTPNNNNLNGETK